jgi:hypothetical protein
MRIRKRNRATVRFAPSSHECEWIRKCCFRKGDRHYEISGSKVMSSFHWPWASAMPPEKRKFDNAPVETASALSRFAYSPAIYGGVAEMQPKVSCAVGLRFHMAHWSGAVDTAVPTPGLPESTTHTAACANASGLTCHLVYDVSTELIRRRVTRWVHPS